MFLLQELKLDWDVVLVLDSGLDSGSGFGLGIRSSFAYLDFVFNLDFCSDPD